MEEHTETIQVATVVAPGHSILCVGGNCLTPGTVIKLSDPESQGLSKADIEAGLREGRLIKAPVGQAAVLPDTGVGAKIVDPIPAMPGARSGDGNQALDHEKISSKTGPLPKPADQQPVTPGQFDPSSLQAAVSAGQMDLPKLNALILRDEPSAAAAASVDQAIAILSRNFKPQG